MQILYLDDSGKIHPNTPDGVAVFAGFSIREENWHTLIRQISGAKRKIFPNRAEGNPHEWEVKSGDFLTSNSWMRGKNRKFCFEMVNVLKRNNCHVYCVSMDKSKAKDALDESKFIPLMLSRLICKFYDQVVSHQDTGSVVLDWSTHQMDHHITRCLTAMTVVKEMTDIRGGVTYGSSAALPPLQIADIIASTLRRDIEGQSHIAELAQAFRRLQYTRDEAVDDFGNQMCSICRVC